MFDLNGIAWLALGFVLGGYFPAQAELTKRWVGRIYQWGKTKFGY